MASYPSKCNTIHLGAPWSLFWCCTQILKLKYSITCSFVKKIQTSNTWISILVKSFGTYSHQPKSYPSVTHNGLPNSIGLLLLYHCRSRCHTSAQPTIMKRRYPTHNTSIRCVSNTSLHPHMWSLKLLTSTSIKEFYSNLQKWTELCLWQWVACIDLYLALVCGLRV